MKKLFFLPVIAILLVSCDLSDLARVKLINDPSHSKISLSFGRENYYKKGDTLVLRNIVMLQDSGKTTITPNQFGDWIDVTESSPYRKDTTIFSREADGDSIATYYRLGIVNEITD